MSFLTYLILGGLGFVFLTVFAAIVLHRKSFRYRCQIAIPTGKDGSDIIWADDNFKVKRVGDHDEIMFLRHKGKAYSPPYNFWAKWIRGTAPNEDVSQWKNVKGDLRRSLIRGAHFIRVSEDEYKVVTLNNKMEFAILDNDSRELYLDDLRRTEELTKKTSDTLIKAAVWVVSLIIISALAIVIFILTTNYAAEQSAEIVKLAGQALSEQAGVGA